MASSRFARVRTLTPVANLPDETARRIRGLIKVRGAVREVLRTQLADRCEDEIVEARRQLNSFYDHFVSRFGAINDSPNRRAFRGDPDLPLLCSLEDYDNDTKRATKASIFRERTIQRSQRRQVAESAHDALVLSLNEIGRVDLARMGALLSRTPDEFLPELKGLLYRNPETQHWETEDQYLSGDVRVKLQTARAAAATDATYEENVTALEAVQPEDLTASEIDARLGAVWIPAADVEAFAKSLLGADGITVSHAAALGTWFVRGDFNARGTIANTTEWGTMRYSALDLIQDALNLKTPTVYDRDRKNDTVVINAQETEAARDRLEKIKERFKTWIWEDDERRERLCRKYNDEFNSARLRVFNGSHLTLPSSSQQITLHRASEECGLANRAERQHAARTRRRRRENLHDGRGRHRTEAARSRDEANVRRAESHARRSSRPSCSRSIRLRTFLSPAKMISKRRGALGCSAESRPGTGTQ